MRSRILLFFILTLPIAINATCVGPYKDHPFSRETFIGAFQQSSTNNFCGVILKNQDLRGLPLGNLDLSFANLEGSNFFGSDLQGVNLTKANLRGANLAKAFLRGANLTAAVLIDANLTGAQLMSAVLNEANFDHADLKNTELKNVIGKKVLARAVDLTSSDLFNANFSDSDFSFSILTNITAHKANFANTIFHESKLSAADLTEANLNFTRLSKADLTVSIIKYTSLKDANFMYAQLTGTFFQPAFGALPNIVSLATARDFNTIKFYTEKIGSPALIELQSAYRRAGIRAMERQITFMLKKHEMYQKWHGSKVNKIESGLSFIFFYLTCDFGLHPHKSLLIFGIIWLLCAVIYRIMLATKQTYIIKKTSNNQVDIKAELNAYSKVGKQLMAIYFSLYFSLLSAFQIGWEDFNIANWLTRLQQKEYSLVACGVARTVSGCQALVSTYLVVLWALSYFGRLFS